MRTEDHQDMLMLHIEQQDQLADVLAIVSTSSKYILLILPARDRRQVFNRAKDFSALRARVHRAGVAFVMPDKEGRAQARACGFHLLFSALDAVYKHAPAGSVITGKLTTTRELSFLPEQHAESFHHQNPHWQCFLQEQQAL
jgi:hypothetical protein